MFVGNSFTYGSVPNCMCCRISHHFVISWPQRTSGSVRCKQWRFQVTVHQTCATSHVGIRITIFVVLPLSHASLLFVTWSSLLLSQSVSTAARSLTTQAVKSVEHRIHERVRFRGHMVLQPWWNWHVPDITAALLSFLVLMPISQYHLVVLREQFDLLRLNFI